ncbi:MAG TPA: TerB N-terminal domain-containing protein, partial [Tepidisphaeraceae bacterium]
MDRRTTNSIGTPDAPLASAVPKTGPEYLRPPRASGSPAPVIWVGHGQSITVGEYLLRDPLIYVRESFITQPGSWAIDRSAPKPENAQQAAVDHSTVPQQYDAMTPSQQRYYLAWLAAGRVEVPGHVAYSLMFVSGLKRRAQVDGCAHRLVIRELDRLRSLYVREGGSDQRVFLQS